MLTETAGTFLEHSGEGMGPGYGAPTCSLWIPQGFFTAEFSHGNHRGWQKKSPKCLEHLRSHLGTLQKGQGICPDLCMSEGKSNMCQAKPDDPGRGHKNKDGALGHVEKNQTVYHKPVCVHVWHQQVDTAPSQSRQLTEKNILLAGEHVNCHQMLISAQRLLFVLLRRDFSLCE